MKLAGFTLSLACIFAVNALGQAPTIDAGGVVNAFSFLNPSLPNYGIAEGSIFAIYGTNLSATVVPLQNQPLQTSLSGVTISVTVNGTVTNPLIYYLSPTQINAVLPSATPAGTGTIAVTNSAGTSAAAPITVVVSDFGLLTWNYGTGAVKGYDANNGGAFIGVSAAANPGEYLELWGTGLGPVANDGTGVAVSPSAQVFIGGVAATVSYSGRSSYTGLDQINVIVPEGVSGCYVSVVVQTGNYVSNFATVPVTASGRTCSDTSNLLTASLLTELSQKGSLSIGIIDLNKSTSAGIDGIGGGTTDTGFAGFFTISDAEVTAGASASTGPSASTGSCVVNFYSTASPVTIPSFTWLNAGPVVNLTGPDGSIAMPVNTVTVGGVNFTSYAVPLSDKSFIPASGGSFTFNNGSGSTSVGGFTAQLTMGAPLVWSNMSSISTVTRSSGLTVTWTGGDPSTYVTVSGASFGVLVGSTTDFEAGEFTCQASTAAGTFTVPSPVLLALPPSFTIAGVSTSTLSVSNVTGPVSFSATGLDAGYVEATVGNSINVAYQ